MPYKYLRRAKRRSAKRSTLSNYKIATRTSARSQAGQIYALKKRINRIQRMTRPETRIIQMQAKSVSFGASSSGNLSWYNSATDATQVSGQVVPFLGPINNNTVGGSVSGTPNNFARLLSFSLYGTLNFAAYSPETSPVTFRVVIVQLKVSRAQLIDASDIFTGLNSTEGTLKNPANRVFGPLQTGLARTCKVLSDRKYYLSFQRPVINIKTKLKYLLSYYRDANTANGGTGSSDEFAKGSIYVFYAFYNTSEQDINGNFNCKLAYSDA